MELKSHCYRATFNNEETNALFNANVRLNHLAGDPKYLPMDVTTICTMKDRDYLTNGLHMVLRDASSAVPITPHSHEWNLLSNLYTQLRALHF
jgi:hypothetical protein